MGEASDRVREACRLHAAAIRAEHAVRDAEDAMDAAHEAATEHWQTLDDDEIAAAREAMAPVCDRVSREAREAWCDAVELGEVP